MIPVHLFGATVDLDPILELTREAGIHVIEDACQAHGARYRGRRAGSIGVLGCFSFYPTKNLGAWGDGGAVVTSVPELDDRIRLLRCPRRAPALQPPVVGTTARLDALQAAVLRRKLRRLEDRNERAPPARGAELRARTHRGRSARRASEAIELVRAAVCRGRPRLSPVRRAQRARDELRDHLPAGVASAIHYPSPIHLTEAYAHLGLGPGSLPGQRGAGRSRSARCRCSRA